MPGAHDRNRTGDLVLTKDVLYRLSYMGDHQTAISSTRFILERVMGIEPTSSAWKAEVLPLNYTRCVRALGAGTGQPGLSKLNFLVEGEGFEPS
jgi:hypothetical protein